MSDLDRSLFAQDEEKGIRAVFGDKADQRIKLAQQLVQELEKQSPGLVAVLEETGAGNSRHLVAQFASQMERLLEKRKEAIG